MNVIARVTLVATAAAIALAACGGEAPHAEAAAEPRIEGTPYAVHDTLIADGFSAAGVAEPLQRAVLSSKLMGRVTAVLVQEGDRVRAGQVLARIDARDLDARSQQVQAGLEAAEAAHREALTHANRIRALYADSAAPKAQLDQAEAGLARAEAGVRQARGAGAELEAMSDYATVRASFSGQVTQRFVDPGAFAAPGQPLLQVEDGSRLRVSVTAGPDAVRQIRRGQRLTATIAGRPAEAVVEGIVPAPGGHLVTVNAMVPNSAAEFRAGSAATLLLPQDRRPALLVPRAAVVRQGDLTGVYWRRGAQGGLRWIRLGPSQDGMIEALSGLSAGDTVLVPPGDD